MPKKSLTRGASSSRPESFIRRSLKIAMIPLAAVIALSQQCIFWNFLEGLDYKIASNERLINSYLRKFHSVAVPRGFKWRFGALAQADP